MPLALQKLDGQPAGIEAALPAMRKPLDAGHSGFEDRPEGSPPGKAPWPCAPYRGPPPFMASMARPRGGRH
jgi:hypothetical protein